jgi:hypothetical protein
MSHHEEKKVTTTTTYEQVDDPPKEQVKNVNVTITKDEDGKTITVDETTVETTDDSQPSVNINAPG